MLGDNGFPGGGAAIDRFIFHKPRATIGLVSKSDVLTTGSSQQMSQTSRATPKYADLPPPGGAKT